MFRFVSDENKIERNIHCFLFPSLVETTARECRYERWEERIDSAVRSWYIVSEYIFNYMAIHSTSRFLSHKKRREAAMSSTKQVGSVTSSVDESSLVQFTIECRTN